MMDGQIGQIQIVVEHNNANQEHAVIQQQDLSGQGTIAACANTARDQAHHALMSRTTTIHTGTATAD